MWIHIYKLHITTFTHAAPSYQPSTLPAGCASPLPPPHEEPGTLEKQGSILPVSLSGGGHTSGGGAAGRSRPLSCAVRGSEFTNFHTPPPLEWVQERNK